MRSEDERGRPPRTYAGGVEGRNKVRKGIDLNAGQGILVFDMNNRSFLHTALDTPSAQDVARYTRPDGTTDHFGQACFEAGWYRAQGENLARSVKALLSEAEAKDKEIERLTSLLKGE